jgi:hypothetical protein
MMSGSEVDVSESRLILMSTHGPGSARNAVISLSQKVNFDEIRRLPDEDVLPSEGYVWAFRDGSPVMRADTPPRTGDLAITTSRIAPGTDGVVVHRIFPVIQLLPGRPDIPEQLGIRWNGDGWNNILLLDDPIVLEDPVPFPLLDARYAIRPGPRFASKFINADADEFLGFARANGVALVPLTGSKKLDWTWEEQLLAFRLARSGNPSSSKDPRVVELSQQLRQLDIHPVAGRPDNFRSPNSVRHKCGDIISHAPGYAGQKKSGSRLDKEVWARFGDFTDEQLDDLAELILAGLQPFDAPGFDGATGAGSVTGPREVTIKGGFTEGSGRRRRGQQAFRKRLLDIVGPICLITGDEGSTPDTVLDAAHLYSFAKTGEHIPQGGTLMRKDVHALFDADLIAVDPDDWTVWVSPALDAFDAYSFLRGKTACDAWRPHLDHKLLADRLVTARAKASRL